MTITLARLMVIVLIIPVHIVKDFHVGSNVSDSKYRQFSLRGSQYHTG